jgi:hypothetical protein
MLEPDQWDSVLGRIAGTLYRGTERISSNALLNALQVDPDPVLWQRYAQRRLSWTGPRAMRIPAENGDAAGLAVIGGYRRGRHSPTRVLTVKLIQV